MERAVMEALELLKEEGRAKMEKEAKVRGVVAEVKVVVGVKEGREGMGKAVTGALEWLLEVEERAKMEKVAKGGGVVKVAVGVEEGK